MVRNVMAYVLIVLLGTWSIVRIVEANDVKWPLTMVNVTATAYSYGWLPGCWKCGGGKHMFSGRPPYVGAIAVSDDLLEIMPIGSVVTIRGWKYRVEDRMASYWRRRIDVFMPTVRQAFLWGKRRVTVLLWQVPGWRPVEGLAYGGSLRRED